VAVPRTRALVTGAGKGIGAAIAGALAVAGHRVAVHTGHDTKAAERTLASLPGDGHVLIVGDVSSPEVCADIFGSAVSGLGGVDVLINNAGMFRSHPVDSTSYRDWQEAWRRTLEVNLLGPAQLTWLMVDHLLHRAEGPTGGRLVSVGSRGAYRGEPITPAYGASKAGLHAMTQSLAVALAPHGIFSAAVAPGFVDTRMGRPALEGAAGQAVRAQSPFNRVAEPEEIAATVAWLATTAPVWASGTVVDVNGASYLR
jgi:3-oxoacyl-[acyl-carrier protein] reductase